MRFLCARILAPCCRWHTAPMRPKWTKRDEARKESSSVSTIWQSVVKNPTFHASKFHSYFSLRKESNRQTMRSAWNSWFMRLWKTCVLKHVELRFWDSAFRATGILARPGNLKCVVSTNNWSFVRNWPTVKCRICSRTTAAGMYVPFLQREQRFRNRRTYLFCAALLGTVCLRVHTLGGNHQLRTRTSLHVTWCTSPSKKIG